ncbi:MAG: MATE family efflux transporter [Erysipelotrichales bacterium]|nr:MATE family efflux transporter [Erysipelotrichales bacterium]
MRIQLSDHFDTKRLLRFAVPSIAMMVFISIYGIVDGIFISNYVGKIPFAAVNLYLPFPMVLAAVGFMFGTGGSAITSRYLGEGRKERANESFTSVTYVLFGCGIVMAVLASLFLEKVCVWMGADAQMLPYCVRYGRINLIGLVPFMIQNLFQSYFVTAGKPKMGLFVTVLAGVTNMFLDYLLVGVLSFGVEGAAFATIFSQCVGAVIPVVYFFLPQSSNLRFRFAAPDWKMIWKTVVNGSSEFVTNISLSLVNMIYNLQLMKYAGPDGVSAYGVIMYINFIFAAVFIGFAIGTAPITGFHYGAKNRDELHSLYEKSIRIMIVMGLAMTLIAFAAAPVLSGIFVGYDEGLMKMTTHAFRIFVFAFLIMGINIFGSSFFTALGNGKISAIISFFRTFVFQIICVYLFPYLWGMEGIWFAIIGSEGMSVFLTMYALNRNRAFYGY